MTKTEKIKSCRFKVNAKSAAKMTRSSVSYVLNVWSEQNEDDFGLKTQMK